MELKPIEVRYYRGLDDFQADANAMWEQGYRPIAMTTAPISNVGPILGAVSPASPPHIVVVYGEAAR